LVNFTYDTKLIIIDNFAGQNSDGKDR